jgi:hypothetical protein
MEVTVQGVVNTSSPPPLMRARGRGQLALMSSLAASRPAQRARLLRHQGGGPRLWRGLRAGSAARASSRVICPGSSRPRSRRTSFPMPLLMPPRARSTRIVQASPGPRLHRLSPPPYCWSRTSLLRAPHGPIHLPLPLKLTRASLSREPFVDDQARRGPVRGGGMHWEGGRWGVKPRHPNAERGRVGLGPRLKWSALCRARARRSGCARPIARPTPRPWRMPHHEGRHWRSVRLGPACCR